MPDLIMGLQRFERKKVAYLVLSVRPLAYGFRFEIVRLRRGQKKPVQS